VVEYREEKTEGDSKIMRAVLSGIKELHALLKATKKFSEPENRLTSYDVAPHAGLSLKQEYELLGLNDELERQKYLHRHLEQVLPVVAEMESLKEKIKLNGHFKTIPGLETW
jgi:hypothetical protein